MEKIDDSILFSKNPFDITKPNIIKIDGFQIRDFETANFSFNKSIELAPYVEDYSMVSCMEVDDNFDIEVTKSGKFLLRFHVSLSYCGAINRNVRQEIEQSTRTIIKLPKRYQDKDNVVMITGSNERDVVTAKNRIDLIIWKARDKRKPTHFISIPMVSDMIKHNFEVFKDHLMKGSLIRGLDYSMFQNPNKLHLTISTLVLCDEFEESEAVRILKQCKEEVIISSFEAIEPIKICLSGLEIMNDDPSNVDVLYGKVSIEPLKYEDLFQKVTDGIVDYFANKGLVRKQYDKVKLHVTLINSLFRKNATSPKRESFDATHILGKYKDFYFGVVDLSFIHLSVRFTTSEGAYYDALATIGIK